MHPFRNSLALLPPPTLYKVETRKNFWIHLVRSPSPWPRPTLFVGWGEGLDLCELENAPESQKCPRLLSMIVGIAHKLVNFASLTDSLFVSFSKLLKLWKLNAKPTAFRAQNVTGTFQKQAPWQTRPAEKCISYAFLQDGRSLQDPTNKPAYCEKRILTLAWFPSKKKLIERILVW